jgi:hypothetical protein
LRFCFVFFFGSVVALLLDDDESEAAAPPSDPPSQSGIEIHSSSRYALSGEDGMSEGRCPLLLHTHHSFTLFSSSPRATARASVKLFHATRGIESIVKEWVSATGLSCYVDCDVARADHIQRSPGFYTV